MVERRKHPRGEPDKCLSVVDRGSGKRIGLLANLSSEGAMLITETPVKARTTLLCRVKLPLPILDRDYIDFDAECRWSRKNVEQGWWESGYLLKMSAVDRELVSYLSLSFVLGDCGMPNLSEPTVVLQENLRNTTRYRFRQPLPVYEQRGYKAIGSLVDLSIQGAKLTTIRPVRKGDLLTCKVRLPKTVFGEDFLSFEAECVWCKKNADAATYSSGYLLRNVSERDAAIILHLIIRMMDEQPAKLPVRVSR